MDTLTLPVQALLHTSSVTDWHQRMGHVNQAALKRMHVEELVTGMGKISDAAVTCRDSLQGKGTKEAYKPQSRPTPVRLMQRVSADLCGPITPQSVSGMRYFLVLVEHASRMFFVYFLREKSDAVGAINCLRIAYAENVTKEHLAVLESDNGGEFTTQELKTFLISKGSFTSSLLHTIRSRTAPQNAQLGLF